MVERRKVLKSICTLYFTKIIDSTLVLYGFLDRLSKILKNVYENSLVSELKLSA